MAQLRCLSFKPWNHSTFVEMLQNAHHIPHETQMTTVLSSCQSHHHHCVSPVFHHCHHTDALLVLLLFILQHSLWHNKCATHKTHCAPYPIHSLPFAFPFCTHHCFCDKQNGFSPFPFMLSLSFHMPCASPNRVSNAMITQTRP